MGAKQSKRSVDISGKEAEAAAEAGGEGRLEPLADPDTLKPQLNGDAAHIQPPEEVSEKEKQLENGTAENEKDATTEKGAVVTNGGGAEAEAEAPPADAGAAADAQPAPDSEKKNKKEKVKKKWSLRSISFSRKDKPKQEKKAKEEEPKTNGDTELPEEGTEATAVPDIKSTEDAKDVTVEENKDVKTPLTPVTEPITNGSSAPESPKEELPAKEDTPVPEKPVEPIIVPDEPEKLKINGLSLDEVKEEVPEIKTAEPAESKAEEPAAPSPVEPASTPDIPVATEVCVGQSPLKEPTPPPLPANPPPSSVTAFAETTMAPHPVDASITPLSEASPALTAPSGDAPSVVDAPLDSKDDVIPPQITSSHLGCSAVVAEQESDSMSNSNDTKNCDTLPVESITNIVVTPEIMDAPEPVSEGIIKEESVQNGEHGPDDAEITQGALIDAKENEIAADLSEIKPVELQKLLEPKIDDIAQVKIEVGIEKVPQVKLITEEITMNGNHKENGFNEDIELPTEKSQEKNITPPESNTKSDVIEIKTVDALLKPCPENSEADKKMNGSIVEAELPSQEMLESEQAVVSEETIPPPPTVSEVISSDIAEEGSISKSEETESPLSPLSEAPPPPAPAQAASESGEENRGSNEEVSESFPLPPSELSAGESEASGPTTPEPPQETVPEAEVPTEISVETIADKTQLPEIVEARVAAVPETAVATAGAGDGAPSD